MTPASNDYPFYCYRLSPLATPQKMTKRRHDNHAQLQYFYLTHRSVFQQDRDRVIHAIAFRRLKHKTQVFIAPKGDHYRTRLTHSLEVAQLARSLARLFGADEDLTETVALAHDIGHPPFGHVGEEALKRALKPIGGFDHNDQALRCLMSGEQRYPHFAGLNLTDQTLLAIAKHNGAFTDIAHAPPMVRELADWLGAEALRHHTGLEGQLATWCDDVAYNAHDIDDGFRAGLLSYDLLAAAPHLGTILRDLHGSGDEQVVISSLTRQLINQMMVDLYQHTLHNLRTANITDWQGVIDHPDMVAGFSPAMRQQINDLRKFLRQHVYLSPSLATQRQTADTIITHLVESLHHDLEWRARFANSNERLVAVRDYIAGMTDHFAIKKYQELTGTKDADLPFSPFRF